MFKQSDHSICRTYHYIIIESHSSTSRHVLVPRCSGRCAQEALSLSAARRLRPRDRGHGKAGQGMATGFMGIPETKDREEKKRLEISRSESHIVGSCRLRGRERDRSRANRFGAKSKKNPYNFLQQFTYIIIISSVSNYTLQTVQSIV